MFTVFEVEQLLVVPDNVYIVVTVGVMLIEVVLRFPGNQVKVVAPPPVMDVLPPLQMVATEGTMVIVGFGLMVKVVEADAVQP
jgi:hypothetical protein